MRLEDVDVKPLSRIEPGERIPAAMRLRRHRRGDASQQRPSSAGATPDRSSIRPRARPLETLQSAKVRFIARRTAARTLAQFRCRCARL